MADHKPRSVAPQRAGSGQEMVVVRRLSFLDAFFLSFGGQSVILSVLTYGATVVLLAGYFSPIAVALGTLIVLLNGLVVTRLSNTHTENGGYYNYAKTLGEKAGVHTGWVYTSYAMLYGGAYIVGASFVVGLTLGLNPVLVSAALTLFATALVYMGAKPSSRYAIATGMLEISVMIYLVLASLVRAHLTVYDPLTHVRFGGGVPLAIILGSSIPTGYGVLAPVSGEVVGAERNVGRAMLSVIVLGGILASIFVFSLANLAYAMSLRARTMSAQEVLGVIFSLSEAAKPLVLFAVLSDGVLGGMSYLLAATRTLWKMSEERHVPALFRVLERGEPVKSLAVLGPIYLCITTAAMAFMGPFKAFLALGSAAAFSSLYVHLMANTSLLKQRLRAGVMDKWFAISLAAVCYTGFNFALSLLGGMVYATVFFATALGGILYLTLRHRRQTLRPNGHV